MLKFYTDVPSTALAFIKSPQRMLMNEQEMKSHKDKDTSKSINREGKATYQNKVSEKVKVATLGL